MNEQIAKVQQETEKLTKENDAAANSKDVLPMEGEEDKKSNNDSSVWYGDRRTDC